MHKKIAIIKANHLKIWASVEEVLPYLISCWQRAADEARIIEVGEKPIRHEISFLLGCDAIVVTGFSEKVARFLISLRKDLQCEVPIIFHLFAQATYACWPLERLGLLPYLNEGDLFIGTCEGDLKALQKTFENARMLKLPFPSDLPHEKKSGTQGFYSIGRISEQKNIHLLLEAYRELIRFCPQAPKLTLFGKEDDWGSPNMGLSSSGLEKRLRLQGEGLPIRWAGFKAREEIDTLLGTEAIFVSASTHSDENFGMAAFRTLHFGGKAVLSSWGGHKEFLKDFPSRVWSSPVIFSEGRPVIDSKDFARKMALSLAEGPSHFASCPYAMEKLAPSYRKVLDELFFSSLPLRPTPLALKIYKQQREFEVQGQWGRVFHSYLDPLAHEYLSTYT